MKSFHSAVVLIPPDEVWEPIQRIRRAHDRNLERWMPHITLLYPFRPREEFELVIPGLERAAAAVAPFALSLEGMRVFDHGEHSATLWLDPEPRAPVDALASALFAEFPECDDTRRYESGFVPHLSVGQLGPGRPAETLQELRASWTPLRFTAQSIAIISRQDDEPFTVWRELALGSR